MDVFSAKHLFFVFVVLLIFSVVSDCSEGVGDEEKTLNNGTTTIEVNATTTPAIISPSSTTEATSQSSQLTTTISVLSSTESTSSQPQSLQPTTLSPSSTAETLTSSPSQTTQLITTTNPSSTAYPVRSSTQTTQLITTTSSSSMTENVISTSPSQNSTQPITTKTLPATEPKTLALTQTAPPPTKEVKTTEKTSSTSKTTAIAVIPTWRRKTVFKGSLTTTPTPIHECLPYPFMIVAISVSAVGGLTVLTFTVLFLVYVLKKKCRSKPKQSIEKVELQVGDYENQM